MGKLLLLKEALIGIVAGAMLAGAIAFVAQSTIQLSCPESAVNADCAARNQHLTDEGRTPAIILAVLIASFGAVARVRIELRRQRFQLPDNAIR
jgi:hypothetical protein